MIVVQCEQCQQTMKVRPERQGKKGKCVSCGHIFTVPTTGEAMPDGSSAPSIIMANPPSLSEQRTIAPGGVPLSLSGERTQLGDSQPTAKKATTTSFDYLRPAEAADEIGRLAHYRVLKVLGEGGMGTVFLADDTQLGRQVALKVMLPSLAANPVNRSRFAREARAVAPLQHDHIITIYHVGEDQDVPYLAMQYLQGETLEQRLRKKATLPISLVLRIARETVDGLRIAHRANIVHRDIKPANIWLERNPTDRVKILDFGLARAAGIDSQLTQAGTIIGTPAYMAPEQASGKAVDGRSDLFSVGCMLYQLTTGKLPFRGGDTLSILTALATHIPPSAHEVNAKVPAALSELIDDLLAKKPDERPANAEEVIARLKRIEAGEHESARPTATVEAAELVEERTVEVVRPRRRDHDADDDAPRRPRKRRSNTSAVAWVIPLVAIAFTGVITIVLVNRSSPQPTEVVNNTITPNIPQKGTQGNPANVPPNIPIINPPPVIQDPLKNLVPPIIPPPITLQPGDMPKALEYPERDLEPLWDAPPMDRLPVAGSPVLTMVASKNGRMLIIGDEANVTGILRQDDKSQFRWHQNHRNRIEGVAITDDGRIMASCDMSGMIFIGDAVRKVNLLSWQASKMALHHVGFTPDGKYLLAGGDEGIVWMWELATGKQVKNFRLPGSQVESFAVSPNGQFLAIGDRNGQVHVWDIPKNQALLTNRSAGKCHITSIAWSPDSKWVGASNFHGADGFCVFEPLDGKVRLMVQKAHIGTMAIVFTLDGNGVITTGIDRTVKLWDLSKNAPIRTWSGHGGQLNALALSPDGKYVMTAGYEPFIGVHKLQ